MIEYCNTQSFLTYIYPSSALKKIVSYHHGNKPPTPRTWKIFITDIWLYALFMMNYNVRKWKGSSILGKFYCYEICQLNKNIFSHLQVNTRISLSRIFFLIIRYKAKIKMLLQIIAKENVDNNFIQISWISYILARWLPYIIGSTYILLWYFHFLTSSGALDSEPNLLVLTFCISLFIVYDWGSLH